ncbi:MAG: DUF1566 domain-containing protein [Thiomargarita sp.]|nr:DUF1566 domain-containing protein [Thiomargarita sp.]
MTIKLFILAVLFIISGGVVFSEYFKNHKFLSLLATAVAIIATFYLFKDIKEDIIKHSIQAQEIPQPVPKLVPSPPVVVSETPTEKTEIPPVQEVEPSPPVVVPENPPENAETQIDFTAYFQPEQEQPKQEPKQEQPNPKKGMFETTAAFQTRRHQLLEEFQAQQRKLSQEFQAQQRKSLQEFQARRHQLLQEFNDEVKQRNLDYRAGVLHLTYYNADSQTFTVNLDWQADWVKQFFGKQNKKSVVKIGVKEAEQIYNEGTEKPLFITASLNDNQVEIQSVMVEKGQTYFLSYYRYIDNGDGTVRDSRTGLIWLKNANCFGEQDWETAMQSTANLASGECGLRDGSRRGMWRLPSKEEWEAMIDEKYVDRENYSQPAISNAAGTGHWKEGDAFSSVQTSIYWSSFTFAVTTGIALYVALGYSSVGYGVKSNTYYVWPVRDGK